MLKKQVPTQNHKCHGVQNQFYKQNLKTTQSVLSVQRYF